MPAALLHTLPDSFIATKLNETVSVDRKGRQVYIDGVRLDAITEDECNDFILDSLDRGRGGYVVTPNVDHLRRCQFDDVFRDVLARADLAVPDGMPVIWASRIQGTPLPARVPGSSLINTLSRAAAERGRSIFLLGGDPGTAEHAAQVLKSRYPNLKVAGTCCPKVGMDLDPHTYERLRILLQNAKPDIVFVGLGSPKQERFIRVIHSVLPQAWWLGIGISFSFVSGRVRRAPPWIQRLGLEWAFRLTQEPAKLARRYLVDGIPFAFGMGLRAFRNRRKATGK